MPQVKHRKVSAEEKRAELGDQWPVCDCHGKPKKWNAHARRGGGFWACRVKARKYEESEEGRKARRKYEESEKGRETKRKYEESEKVRKANRERNRERRAHERNLRRLAMVMRNIAHYERRWGRKVAALIRMATDDRETANENERDLAYQHLRRLGWLE